MWMPGDQIRALEAEVAQLKESKEMLRADLEEANSMLSKNEGRVKEIVDDSLIRQRDNALLQNRELLRICKILLTKCGNCAGKGKFTLLGDDYKCGECTDLRSAIDKLKVLTCAVELHFGTAPKGHGICGRPMPCDAHGGEAHGGKGCDGPGCTYCDDDEEERALERRKSLGGVPCPMCTYSDGNVLADACPKCLGRVLDQIRPDKP